MIKHYIEISHKDYNYAFWLNIELPYRLVIGDRVYVWDFIKEDEEVPNWVEEGTIAVITEITIYEDSINCISQDLTNEI